MALSGRLKASILWGAIGALAFLVLAEAYLVLSTAEIALSAVVVAGFVVFLLASLASYVAEPYVTTIGQ